MFCVSKTSKKKKESQKFKIALCPVIETSKIQKDGAREFWYDETEERTARGRSEKTVCTAFKKEANS